MRALPALRKYVSKSSETLTETRNVWPEKNDLIQTDCGLISWCVHAPASPGGLSKVGSDPMKLVNDAVEESTNLFSVMLKFAASLVAPEEDEGTVTTHAGKQTVTLVIINKLGVLTAQCVGVSGISQ